MSGGGSEGRLTHLSRGTRPTVGTYSFYVPGQAAVVANPSIEFITPVDLRAIRATILVKTAPTGSTLIGTFTAQPPGYGVASAYSVLSGNVIAISATSLSGSIDIPATLSAARIPAFSKIRFNLTQVGSTIPGAEVSAHLDAVQ